MRIPESVLDRIAAHAAAEYPAECCGLLVGRGDEVRAAKPVRNLRAGERWDRFVLDPLGHVKVWEAAHAAGEEVIGCYHSHPDGQPSPSSIDRRLARDFGGPFGYLVVSIDQGQDCLVYAGMIGADGEIAAIPLEVNGDANSA